LCEKRETRNGEYPEQFGKEFKRPFPRGTNDIWKKGTVIYYTRNDAEMNGIFSAVFNGSAWEKITPFQYNEANSKRHIPVLSADGKKLFFVSDRHGGYGGFDIYVCTMNRQSMEPAKEILGPEINTA